MNNNENINDVKNNEENTTAEPINIEEDSASKQNSVEKPSTDPSTNVASTQPTFTAEIPFDINNSLNYKKQIVTENNISEKKEVQEITEAEEMPEVQEILIPPTPQNRQPYNNLPYQNQEKPAQQYASGNYIPQNTPQPPYQAQQPYGTPPYQNQPNPYINMQQNQGNFAQPANPYFYNVPKEKDNNLISIISLILSLAYSLSFGFFIPFLLFAKPNKSLLFAFFVAITSTIIAISVTGIVKHRGNNGKSKAALIIMIIAAFISTFLIISLSAII